MKPLTISRIKSGDTRRRALTLIACLLMPLSSLPAWGMTLREAADLAVKGYPDVLAAQEYGKALDQKVQQALAGYLPKMDFSAGYGPERSDNSTTRAANQAAGKSDRSLSMNRGETALIVRQNVFDGFDVRSRVAQSKAQLQAAQSKLTAVSDNVALQAVSAYIDLVLKYIQLEMIKENVLLHQRILSKVEEKFKGGAGTEADVDQTRSRTYLASANHATNQAAYKNAQAKFIELIAVPPLKETEMFRPQTPVKLLPKSVEEATESALHNSAELEEARLNVVAAEFALEIAKATLSPKLDMELSGSENRNVQGTAGPGNSLAAMLRMNVNLFEGGAGTARIQEQRNLLDQSRQNMEKTKRSLEEGIQEAWNKLTMSKERINFLKQHFEVSKRVTASYHDQFKMGKRTLLDVLNSENELFAAKNGLLFEELNHTKSGYELLAKMGGLRNALNEETATPPAEKISLPKDTSDPASPDRTSMRFKPDAHTSDTPLAALELPQNGPYRLEPVPVHLPEMNLERVAYQPATQDRNASLENPPMALDNPAPQQQKQEATIPQETITTLLKSANQHFKADRLTRPKDGNALDAYRQILKLDPDHPQARQGIQRVTERLLVLARDDLENWRLVSPREHSAQEKLRLVLAIDAGNTEAKAGLEEIVDRLLSLAQRYAEDAGKMNRYLIQAEA
ncbi:MAG: TolC family outer membrane protein, partial [Magnetococcales bacterium]|nr:TolC family outer membrane protein [Magnetococcales bacterium]